MLNPHPIVRCEYKMRDLSIFDCTRNPTLSFKDRASILVALKAIQSKIKQIAAASTGNAASSLAGICASLGLEAHLFVPETIPEAKRIQIQAYGANIYLVKGTYDQAFDLSINISDRNRWYNRNTAFNPLTIEGKKSAAYDMFLATKGSLPDIVFIPVGDGVIISGIYKGFHELQSLGLIEHIPKLIAVQAEGSDALVRYLKHNLFESRPALTIADSICAQAPRNLYMAAEAVRKTGGNAVSVSDQEIIEAQRILAREFGILAEPAASAALAGYVKMQGNDELEDENHVMLLISGHGLKDFESLKTGIELPEARTPDEWKSVFK
ncbi:pyridoxal-phosphate dependent enzyme [candidate division KSB1 bacterium]|nr:pyridoxal-phosphate dependent enzyme [candidate division KSB1 bacterium]